MSTIAQRVGINLRDYQKNSEQRGWGTGWPKCEGANGNLVIVNTPLTTARFSVHRRVSRLVSWWCDRAVHIHGYRFKPPSCGAFNCRPIGGTQISSNHSWGLAFDVNWGDNPYTSPLRTDIPLGMIDDANYIGFAWGGHYTGKKDAMHFEFMGTPRQADDIVGILFGGAVPPRQRPALKQGSKGPDVEELQRLLMIEVDGDFGPTTEKAVRQFQQRHGIPSDGVVGPQTWAALDRELESRLAQERIARERLLRSRRRHMREIHFFNDTDELKEFVGLVSIDPVGTSIVMPTGSRAWFQWHALCLSNPESVADLWWLVEGRSGAPFLPHDPMRIKHRDFGAFELKTSVVSVEIGIKLPPGFAFTAHIDVIGHG